MVTRVVCGSRSVHSNIIRTCFTVLCLLALAIPIGDAMAQDPEDVPVEIDEVTAEEIPEVDEFDEIDEVVDIDDDPTADDIPAADQANIGGEEPSGRGIETITVTARKREDDLQDVPIPMTAFSGQTLDVNRIEDTLDLQFNVPNLLFSRTNFTGSNLQIRGIGNQVVAASGEPAIGIHVNEVPLTASRLFEQEFFDIERIEVLRGPQGTLFGRNATGGAFNIYTRKPTDEYEATGEVSAGNYKSARVKGAVNIPLTDSLRTRVAGMYLRRDGFIENLNTGNDIDDRSLYGVRGSIIWELTDNFSMDGMVSWFKENDKRSRIGKQLCTKDDRPGVYSLGCTDAPPTTESVASYATLGGILEQHTIPLLGPFFGPPFDTLQPLYTPGYDLPAIGVVSDPFDAEGFNPPDLRQHFSRIDPSYEADELFANLAFNFDQDYGSFKALFGYQKTSIHTVQDYNMGSPTIPYNNAAGLAAAIALAGMTNCTSASGNPGFTDDRFGWDFGCADRSFAQDNSDAEAVQVSAEGRFTSDFDGPFNFTAGMIYTYFSVSTDYRVFFSGAELASRIWSLIDTSYDVENLRHFNNESDPARTKSFGLFAEGEYEFGESWTFTGGLRYTNDQKEQRSRNYLLNGFLTGSTSSLPQFEKQEASWNEVTGRAIIQKDLDLDFADQANVFLSYSRGYKPGGFNPPAAADFPGTSETFDPEYINAYELGTKARWLENTLQTNASVFFYDYRGYQISKIVNRTSVNENVDAFVWGAELELVYEVIENFFFTTNFAYLGTKIRDAESLDPADPVGGEPGWAAIKRLDNASNIVCVSADGINCDIPPPAEGSAEPFFPATYEDADGNLNPGYAEGFAKDLNGNELPNAPKFNINIGASYTFKLIVPGEFTPRISYYWQSEMYGRLFNSERDKIGAWSQANAGLRWNDDENRVWVDFWIQNFTNNNDITTQYFTDASSGNFTNVFLLDPLTVGGTVGFSF